MRYSYGFSDWRGMVGSTGGDTRLVTPGRASKAKN